MWHNALILIVEHKINKINKKNFRRQSNNKSRDWPHMIQAEFENGIEDENNFQIQEIDFQNGADEDDA